MLVNAVYFKAKWETPFEPQATYDEHPWYTKETPADVAKKAAQTVAMMKVEDGMTIPYAEGNGYQLILLPYEGKHVAMGVLLPRKADGLAGIRGEIGWRVFEKLLTDAKERKVMVRLPRFRVAGKVDLKGTLAGMGMKSAFAGDADLTGITEQRPLWFTNVLHEEIVDVGEEGTEAVAATATAGGGGGLAGTCDFYRGSPVHVLHRGAGEQERAVHGAAGGFGGGAFGGERRGPDAGCARASGGVPRMGAAGAEEEPA